MSEKIFHLHMVSDATGETLEKMAKAALVQFEGLEVKKHFWPMIRSDAQTERLVEDIKNDPGLVIFTIVNEEIREALVRRCSDLGLPMLSVLDPIIDSFAEFFGAEAEHLPGRQYVLDSEYFERIEALQYSMAHDDGHLSSDIKEADIILVGVSRTSKTPTSIYLANRGFRTANIPYVGGRPMPKQLEEHTKALIVGLTAAPERLVQIRTNRLRALNQTGETDYVRPDMVADEVQECRRYCSRHGWHMIDVTRRSIEETAAEIIAILSRRETQGEKQGKINF